MYQNIYEELKKTGRVKTAILLSGPFAGNKCMVKDGKCITCGTEETCIKNLPDWNIHEEAITACEETKVICAGDTDIFVEIYVRNPRLIILGGGHVSVFVAKIGKILGFHITVMDDREEFVTKERFPDADERIIGSFNELDEKIPPYENAYYVVVTRGHLGDTECARRILRRPYQYFGMIGSKNKVRITRENLLKEGFTENQINTIHAPIGLTLGGQLPEEIAVSILAEIIQVKNSRYVTYADENVEAAVMENKKGTMLTIIQQNGSSPRGIGSKMFVDTENRIYGSIGGGNVEYQALKHAPEVTQPKTKYYRLTNEGSANLGMICGGEVEVLFEPVK